MVDDVGPGRATSKTPTEVEETHDIERQSDGSTKKSKKASADRSKGSVSISKSSKRASKQTNPASFLSLYTTQSIRTGDDVVKNLKWVIFPDNKYIKTWDLVVLAALGLFAFILPYQIGVSGGVAVLNHIPWLVFNVFLNAIFFVDTFLPFFRAYYTPNGHLVLDLSKIRRRYLRTYFIPNFISVLPYTLVFYIVATKYLNAISSGEDPNSRVTSSLSFIIMASILKLIRLTRANAILSSSDMVTNFRQQRNSQVLELWKYVWLIVVVSHWFACIWCFIAILEADGLTEEKLLGTTNWIGSWYDSNGVDGGLYPLGWDQHIDRYVLSLFWAIQTITSIGYGNIVPVTRAEYFTACGIQLCAGMMWAYVIGGLVGVASGMNVRAETYRTRMDQANELIDEFEDPDEISEDEDEPGVALQSKQVAKHIRKYIHKQYVMSKGESCASSIQGFYPVFETLTPELQKASSVLLSNPYLKIVPYLSSKYMNEECQSIVAMKCVNLEFASGETIATENPVEGLGRGVFVFRSGCAFNFDKSCHAGSVAKKFENMGLVTAGMAYGVGKVLLADDNPAAAGKLEFLTFSQVVFIPRDAIMEALEKCDRAKRDCARWIYLRTLILAQVLSKEGLAHSSSK